LNEKACVDRGLHIHGTASQWGMNLEKYLPEGKARQANR
jgi:hypothetical protein